MANEEHLQMLCRGAESWNKWRTENQSLKPNVSGAMFTGKFADRDLSGIDLSGADLTATSFERANFQGANFSGADLRKATFRDCVLTNTNFTEAILEAYVRSSDVYKANLTSAKCHGAVLMDVDLSHAQLNGTEFVRAKFKGVNLYNSELREAKFMGSSILLCNLTFADLTNANLTNSDLTGSNFHSAKLMGAKMKGAKARGAIFVAANLSDADLSEVDLTTSVLVGTNVRNTCFRGCQVYGASIWDLQGDPKDQTDLKVAGHGGGIRVDDLEVAQFIYLLLRREKVRNVIDTITSKVVLILGRFIPERKIILDTIAEQLRLYGLVPVIFDFKPSAARDFTETVKILAGMSLFVIVDITNPKSSPLELQATVPNYEIPFVPIIQKGEDPFSMFGDLNKYGWILKPVIGYSSLEELRDNFKSVILDRAWEKRRELQKKKAAGAEIESIEEFLKHEKHETEN